MALDRFITHVKTIGLLTSSKFELVAPMIDGSSLTTSSTVSMLCNASNLPGHTIMTNELRYFGEATERPHGISYAPVNLSFYLDNDLSAKRYFDQWSDNILNRDTREIGYYDNYTRDVELVVYSKDNVEIERIKLYECFPKSISDIALDYSSTGTAILSVQMVYKWWSLSDSDKTKSSTSTTSVPLSEITQYGLGGTQADVESLGNTTGNTSTGNTFEVNPITDSLGTNAQSAFQQAGANILVDSNRNLTQASNLFGISNITSSQYSDVGELFSDNASAMTGNFSSLANSISSLGTNIEVPASSTPAIAASLGNIAVSLSSMGNLVGSVGGSNTSFNTIATNLSQNATAISTTTDASVLQGQLYSVSANLSAAGSAISNSITDIKTSSTLDRTAELAFTNTSNTFLNSGSILNTAANYLN